METRDTAEGILKCDWVLRPSSVQLGWNTSLQSCDCVVGHGVDSPEHDPSAQM